MSQPPLPIVLIGPMATGKSTLGAALAKALKCEQFPMDGLRWYYYFKAGYSLRTAESLEFRERLAYWKPFEVIAVESVVKDFRGVIDFGAGHGHFERPEHLERVKQALAGLPVIFILPDEDLEKSLSICNQRYAERKGIALTELSENELITNREFVYSDSFRALATRTFYTKQESPEASAQRLIQLMGWA